MYWVFFFRLAKGRGKRERENNNKCIEERKKITHVLAIKDGFGLDDDGEEEESRIRTTISRMVVVVVVTATTAATFDFLLFVLSVDGSVYFTIVKNKENINKAKRERRKDRLSFCARTHTHTHTHGKYSLRCVRWGE